MPKLSTRQAREMNAARKTYGAGTGRPRSKSRCFCGEMTLKRALARRHKCPACPVPPESPR